MSNTYWGQSASDELLSAIVEFVECRGAFRGLLGRMEDIGLGSVARSWLHGGGYAPILSGQLHALFGTAALRGFAAKVNLSPRDMVRKMSEALPRVLNRLAAAHCHE